MRCLELACGTKSISRCFENAGWECVTVDIDKKFEPDIVANILDLPVDKFEEGSFDYVHFSPPCTQYSCAKTCGVRDLKSADAIVEHGLANTRHIKPKCFTVENPQSGLLKRRSFMQGIPWVDASYCQYGFPYRKTTRFWTNLQNWHPRTCSNNCPVIMRNCTGRMCHPVTAQKGQSKRIGIEDKSFSSKHLYRIPESLCESLLQAVTEHVLGPDLARYDAPQGSAASD